MGDLVERLINRSNANGWLSDHELMREAAAEITRLRAELAEETAIVDRIWEMFGKPSYEQLAGRSIYDLIAALRSRAEKAEAVVVAARGIFTASQMDGDIASRRLQESLRSYDEAGATA